MRFTYIKISRAEREIGSTLNYTQYSRLTLLLHSFSARNIHNENSKIYTSRLNDELVFRNFMFSFVAIFIGIRSVYNVCTNFLCAILVRADKNVRPRV